MGEKKAQKNNHPSGKCKFISVYRLSLVRDRKIQFQQGPVNNSIRAQWIAKKLIETQGQSDREQFCVILVNANNDIIGLNIASTGDLLSAIIHPREVLKPAILANAYGMILCHNHPSENMNPSPEDITITRRIVHASKIMGIEVHEHLIISMDSDEYYSFADNGMIKQFYDEINSNKKLAVLTKDHINKHYHPALPFSTSVQPG